MKIAFVLRTIGSNNGLSWQPVIRFWKVLLNSTLKLVNLAVRSERDQFGPIMRDAIFQIVNCSYLRFSVVENRNKVNNGPRNCSRCAMRKNWIAFLTVPINTPPSCAHGDIDNNLLQLFVYLRTGESSGGINRFPLQCHTMATFRGR
jgi:hypothetical protein